MNSPVETTSGTQRVTATRRQPGAAAPRTLAQDIEVARIVAKAMDSSFQIGPVKFGLDALIGLIPAAGDAVTFAIGLYPVYLAKKHKLGKLVVAKMLGNLGLDFVTGVFPVVGDAFDVLFKANLKNLKLLEDAAAKRMR